MTPSQDRTKWGRLAAVALSAFVIAFVVDRLIARRIPLPAARLEIDDGIRALEANDPRIIVLGSSHARSFIPWADSVNRRRGRRDVVVIPEEGGSFYAFDWVWRHRVEPVLEATPHRRLRTVVLVTTYWDLCPGTENYYRQQLATRAWQFHDFAADVAEHGIGPENRNFVRTRFHDLFAVSPLVADRGVGLLSDRLFGALRGLDTTRAHTHNEERRAARITLRLAQIEAEGRTCHARRHLDAMADLIEGLTARQVHVVLVSFPLAAATLSPVSLDSTVPSYRRLSDSLARARSITVLDLVTAHPLVTSDFEPDMDHVTRPAAIRLGLWFDQSGITDSLLAGTGS